jgi:sugar/nucleoside kinase (ribokinase family)
MIALLGNLARDLLPGLEPRVGGAPFHCARALTHVQAEARIYARCAEADRGTLLPPVVALGTPVTYVDGASTASFEISYDGDLRSMNVVGIGDTWLPDDVPALPRDVTWLHVAPLARSDFPAETLARAARGRRLSLDGQGLVRPARLGELVLDTDFDPEMLRHVWALKLNDEEAEIIGGVDGLGVRELLLTHGSRGATIHWEGRTELVPAFDVGTDPTGAGDSFCIAYIAARSTGFTPPEAARRATSVVAAVLTGQSPE